MLIIIVKKYIAYSFIKLFLSQSLKLLYWMQILIKILSEVYLTTWDEFSNYFLQNKKEETFLSTMYL